jgi:hypothetical protein
MDSIMFSTYWQTLYNVSDPFHLDKIEYGMLAQHTKEKVEESACDYTEKCQCEKCLPTEPATRSRNVGKESRKRRARPVGQDKRWSPPEKIKTTKGSPADQKAKKIAMDIKRQRKWIEPFLAEPLCHDLVIHNKKKPEWIPPKKVRVRKPIYDKPCGGVVANYCINKWPTCPSQSMTDIYIAPRWPIFN